ncbi:hypothetical protein BDZ91DRAFT_765644 [Kalaharituber pfeilii]|nr:hypothetical protein BDZ91DRAFT_765644 [Kalaharituber pfeilii]
MRALLRSWSAVRLLLGLVPSPQPRYLLELGRWGPAQLPGGDCDWWCCWCCNAPESPFPPTFTDSHSHTNRFSPHENQTISNMPPKKSDAKPPAKESKKPATDKKPEPKKPGPAAPAEKKGSEGSKPAAGKKGGK